MRLEALLLLLLTWQAPLAAQERVSADVLFANPKAYVSKKISIGPARCIEDERRDIVCEVKGLGGKSVALISNYIAHEVPQELFEYFNKNCLGTAQLNSKSCQFNILTEIRMAGERQYVDVPAGSVPIVTFRTGGIFIRR